MHRRPGSGAPRPGTGACGSQSARPPGAARRKVRAERGAVVSGGSKTRGEGGRQASKHPTAAAPSSSTTACKASKQAHLCQEVGGHLAQGGGGGGARLVHQLGEGGVGVGQQHGWGTNLGHQARVHHDHLVGADHVVQAAGGRWGRGGVVWARVGSRQKGGES